RRGFRADRHVSSAHRHMCLPPTTYVSSAHRHMSRNSPHRVLVTPDRYECVDSLHVVFVLQAASVDKARRREWRGVTRDIGGVVAKRSLLIVWDTASWVMAVAFVVLTRYDLLLTQRQWTSILVYGVLACAAQLVVGTLLKLYLGKY